MCKRICRGPVTTLSAETGQVLYTLMGEYDNTTQTMNLTDSLFNTYNADGRLSDVKWYSLSGSALVYSNHSTYSYDDANRTVLIYDYRVSGAAEVLQYKIDQFFNTDGTIHEENFYSFDQPPICGSPAQGMAIDYSASLPLPCTSY